MEVLWSLLGFVIVMGLIVTIHEWGHYQVARWFDIKVLKFSIGFGKPIYRKQGQETEFVISQIPLGGYVKFADEREAEVPAEDLHRAFNRQSVYKRFAVVAAGPIVNIVFAWLAFTVMYMVGISGFKPIVGEIVSQSPVAIAFEQSTQSFEGNQVWSIEKVNDEPVFSWQTVHQQLLQAIASGDVAFDLELFNHSLNQNVVLPNISLTTIDINQRDQNWLELLGLKPAKPLIPANLGEIVENSPAAKAGLKSGDKVISINEIEINNWQDFVKVVQLHPGQIINVTYLRDSAEYSTHVQLLEVDNGSGKMVGKMGVGVLVDNDALKDYMVVARYDFVDAVDKALTRSVDLIEMSLVMLKRMLIGEVSTDNLSGPISIAQFSGQAVQSGLIAFLSLVGLLSLSIGILNLLPIPVLDGGHLMFYLIEIIKGSPVSEQTMMVGQTLGVMVIVGLTFLAIFNDVLRIFHG